jgi:hypothetical protein
VQSLFTEAQEVNTKAVKATMARQSNNFCIDNFFLRVNKLNDGQLKGN